MKRTIKFKLQVMEGTPENKCLSKKEAWALINTVSDAMYKGANLLSASIYAKEQMSYNIVTRTPGYSNMTKEEKKELFKQYGEDYSDIILGSNGEDISPQALIGQYIKEKCPFLPPVSAGGLGQELMGKLTKSAKEVGTKSMPSFRRGYPIIVGQQQFFFYKEGDSYYARYSVYGQGKNNKSIFFKVVLGKKAHMAGMDKELDKIISTKWTNGKFGFISGKLTNGDDLMYSVFVESENKATNVFISGRVVGVDIGMKIPAVVSLNTTGWSEFLGDNAVLRTKLKHRGQMRSLKSAISKMTAGGHGYAQKMQKLEEFKEYEHNFTKNYTYNIARDVVDFAIKQKAGIIHLELLEGLAKEKKLNGLFPYAMLQTRICQLAELEGIVVVFIDPYHTSKTCSCCGVIGERTDQATFICGNQECKGFGKIQNADKNASWNIAKSTKVVDKIEDCQYYKNKNEETDKEEIA